MLWKSGRYTSSEKRVREDSRAISTRFLRVSWGTIAPVGFWGLLEVKKSVCFVDGAGCLGHHLLDDDQFGVRPDQSLQLLDVELPSVGLFGLPQTDFGPERYGH